MTPMMRQIILDNRIPAVQGKSGVYTDCGNSALFNLTTGITIEAIIKLDKTLAEHATILSKENAYVMDIAYPSYKVRFWGKASGVVKGIEGPTNDIDLGPTALKIGTKYHLAGTFDGTTWTIYINGEIEKQGTSAVTLDTNTNIVRLFSRVNVRYLLGLGREVRLWNVARTQAEIREYMNKGLVGNETGLVAYYPCDEKRGTILHDRCNENNGVLSSASWGWMK